MMSKKKRKKMTEQIAKTPETPREVIGTNPDGTPIYREPVTEVTQTPEHTGENPTPQPM